MFPLPSPTRAVWMLTAATVGWGLSFALTKAVLLAQENHAPGRNSWLYAGLSLIVRFGVSGLLLALWRPRSIWKITPCEWQQGLGLGLFGGIGILLQADGLHYTDASTSAFLTQFYCMLLPLVVAIRRREPPSIIVTVSCLAVLAGVALLANVDLHTLRIGRGELETLAASVLFTAQILWLERATFRTNDTTRMTLVMFLSTAVLLAVMTAPHAHAASDFLLPLASFPIVVLLAALTLFSTLFAYSMMNRWQPHVDATHAGLIYCAEPLFASVFALFLPAWLSSFAGIDYANEHPGINLLLGGSLITAANLLMLFHPAPKPSSREARK